MNILVAPNAFKGSLSAKRVGELICEALKKEIPHVSIEMIPMADGGEGTIESLLFAYRDQSDLVEIQVTGSHGKTIQTHYGVLKHLDTAVIEVASIVGLSLLTEEERKPLELGTYGVGRAYDRYWTLVFAVSLSVLVVQQRMMEALGCYRA